jgi:hypothetical protein
MHEIIDNVALFLHQFYIIVSEFYMNEEYN